jgi:nitroreductase
METWDAIRARRNVRSYPPDAVPEEHLTRIAEAGWRAPSASNRQHGGFIVVTDRGPHEHSRSRDDLAGVEFDAGQVVVLDDEAGDGVSDDADDACNQPVTLVSVSVEPLPK